ncbi:uncharacterized protein [Malus domestica]
MGTGNEGQGENGPDLEYELGEVEFRDEISDVKFSKAAATASLSLVISNNPSHTLFPNAMAHDTKPRKLYYSHCPTFLLPHHCSPICRDTLKSVLIPCYDMSSRASFLFSWADTVEMNCYDSKMMDVCAATSAQPAVEVRSVDGRTKLMAVDGGIAMNNPTTAAIT